jgi:hypothetical protein
MSRVSRRTFLHTAAALPVLAAPAVLATSAPGQQPMLDPVLLRALAHTVLPSELGDAGIERAAAGFERWLAAYEPVAEVNHGYGTDELDYLPAHPGPGFGAQLQALELEASRRSGRGFAELDHAARQELVRRHLSGERSLPRIEDARHVALGLLAWWVATPEATDLAYRARIAKETCRPLADAPAPPQPLEGG